MTCRCGCGCATRQGRFFANRSHYIEWLRNPLNAGAVTAMVKKGHDTRLQSAQAIAEQRFTSKAQAWSAGHRQGRKSERAWWVARYRRLQEAQK